MTTAADILDSIVKYGGNYQLTVFLKSCDESRAFSSDNEETATVIASTNRLLNESSTRRHGLLMLKCLLGQSPSNLIQANLISWLQQAVNGLSQKESSSTVFAAAEVSYILLAVSSKFADCRKQIALNTVGKLLEVLYELKDSPEFWNVVLSSLRILQEHYGKSVTSSKDKFEKFLFSIIEKDDHTVHLASRCYLGLAACGLPGNDNVNYKDGWASQYKSLSSSLHILLDSLFENVNEIEQFSRGLDSFKPNTELPPVNDRLPFMRLSRLSSQFVSLCTFLKTMLLGPFPVSKRVVPEMVLSVACRGLAVTVRTLQAQVTSDTPILVAQIPRIHSSCLSIIQGLIKSCRTNLIAYGPVICKLISQVLKSTEIKKGLYGQHKPYRSVRMAAYDCLTSWLTVSNCSSSLEKHPEIIEFIVSDIQFKKPTVTLNFSSKVLKGRIGKKQRQALVNQTVGNKEEFIADREANKEICLAALKSIPPLLESTSTLLPPQAHKDLQTAVRNQLLITQLNSGDRVPLPYSDKWCRLGLYKSFVSMCHNYHPSFPPPLSFASQLISSGLQDPCDKIVQFCTVSLSSVDKILRPIGPTLSYPIELPEVIFTSKKNPLGIPHGKAPRTVILYNDSGKEVKSPSHAQSDDLNGSSSTPLNGISVISSSHSPEGTELEENPYPLLPLVDSEMSDFDMIDFVKPCTPCNNVNPVPSSDDITVVETCTQAAPNSGEINMIRIESSDSSNVNGNIKNYVICTENGENHSKRKPELDIGEASTSTKRSKFVELAEDASSSGTSLNTQLSQNIISGNVNTHLEMSVEPTTKNGIAADEGKDSNTDNPVDEMEKEMLNSFVDELN